MAEMAQFAWQSISFLPLYFVKFAIGLTFFNAHDSIQAVHIQRSFLAPLKYRSLHRTLATPKVVFVSYSSSQDTRSRIIRFYDNVQRTGEGFPPNRTGA